MQTMYKLVFSALVVALVMVYGCSDRGYNAAPNLPNDSGNLIMDHVFYDELTVQIRNEFQRLPLVAYAPNWKEWLVPPTSYEPPERMPVLILLPPNGGDQYYYFDHGLAQIANQLIEEIGRAHV